MACRCSLLSQYAAASSSPMYNPSVPWNPLTGIESWVSQALNPQSPKAAIQAQAFDGVGEAALLTQDYSNLTKLKS
ncbi:hypothetical protein CVT26_014105 [Gymnopilus dilepis]|uniref:Uncharacterized protein n=1 Tax=Gymnopilus dilepis TaxID=231916 RepID=A0A409Y856_9AGAR|nr:hypothetical protein CVT26_014105 [Gymnopilus dilepis]